MGPSKAAQLFIHSCCNISVVSVLLFDSLISVNVALALETSSNVYPSSFSTFEVKKIMPVFHRVPASSMMRHTRCRGCFAYPLSLYKKQSPLQVEYRLSTGLKLIILASRMCDSTCNIRKEVS